VESDYAAHVARYGYQPIRTPIFEDIELFIRSSGETSDIVSKEMYEFRDRSDRHLALKPEGTAGVIRAYLEHNLGAPGLPVRLFYATPCFRYGRPGKGRHRQLHQLGLELIGSGHARADAEVITVGVRFLESQGLQGLDVGINTIGQPAERAKFGERILSHLSAYLADETEEERAKAQKNPFRLLDTKIPALRAALEGLPPVTDFISDASRAHFDELQQILRDRGVNFRVAPEIVRGLDYYTDTVFEVTCPAFSPELAIFGGGRYDGLVSLLGGPATPCCGYGIGIERLIEAKLILGAAQEANRPDAAVVAMRPEDHDAAHALADALRRAGLTIIADADERNAKAQFKLADRTRARFALIIGESEANNGTVSVKDLDNVTQVTLDRDKVETWLRESR
jgi:histidyl-tRNA synthetase